MSPKPDETPRTIVGWREYVALPEWGVPFLRAKADTGARTSAIDVANVVELDGGRVRFEIVVSRDGRGKRTLVETEIVRRTRIKSSFGAARDRLVVRTLMRLGPIEKPVELGLVSRKRMLCRVLIGREALEPEMIVDPLHRYVHGRRPRSRRRRKGGEKA